MDEPLQVSYDEKEDVLYLHTGERRPAMGIPHPEMGDLILNVDFVTQEPIGAAVFHYREKDREAILRLLPFPCRLMDLP